MKIFMTLIITIILLALIGLTVIMFGLYNVSAMNPDTGIKKWILSTASDNSVERHAAGITGPPLDDSSMVVLGYTHYSEMCVTCHGAPGIEPSEIGQGLNPHPPNLARSTRDMSDGEIFWVTKNGIKMTGMPAFGKTHSDDKIWAIVAFVKKMQNMTAEQYNAYGKTAGNTEVMGQ
ncbi:Cytochrome C class I protein [Candidatus Zixiibacteriota bacterium]|nr:Cytochrome C class I protein [candidate division Zixibacteria bacterium]